MKIVRWLDEYLEEVFMVVLLAAISFVMLAQIFARYVLNDSMSWPEEFCRYCYIWTVFFSLGYTIKKGNMLRVGVVTDLFPVFVRNAVKILCEAVALYLFWLLFRRALVVTGNIKNITHEISSAMRLPMWLMYMSTVIGFGLAIIRTAQSIVHNLRHFGDKAETTIEATLKEAKSEAELAAHDDLAYRGKTEKGGDD